MNENSFQPLDCADQSVYGVNSIQRRKPMRLIPLVTLCLAATVRFDAAQDARVQQLVLLVPELGEIRYALSIPNNYEPNNSYPLVLALHPGGARTPYYGGAFMNRIVQPALSDWGAIILAPDCPTRAWTSAKAERAVLALLDEIPKRYAVDSDRILVTGFSLGGRGTWFLATRHSHIFSGAIPIAGSPGDDSLDALGSMPVNIIHSRDDEVVPIEPARKAVKMLKLLQNPVKFTELSGIGHFAMSDYISALTRAGTWMMQQWQEER